MRTVGSVGEVTQKKIYDVATKLIAAHGYEAVSMRQIAKGVGIQVGSLYNHISNKQELLYQILRELMNDLLDGSRAKVRLGGTPTDQLKAFVDFHVTFHTSKTHSVLIGTREIKSLTAINYKKIVQFRDEYEEHLRKILEEGCRAGYFKVDDMRLCIYATMAMLTGVSLWFNPRGPLSSEDVVQSYQVFALRLAGARTIPEQKSKVTSLRTIAKGRVLLDCRIRNLSK